MKQKEFRQLQNTLDGLGVLTAIIRSGKSKGRRYEVLANGELLKKYKHRVSAKNRILRILKLKLKEKING